MSDAPDGRSPRDQDPRSLPIHVDPLPLPAARRDGDAYADVVVVVDVLRTSTVVPILFERGLDTVRLSPSVRVARRAAADSGDLLIGERSGLPPEGFNHGNSPAALAGHDFGGRAALMVSENAPAALPPLTDARALALGSLVNASAVAAWAAANVRSRIDIVCCGFRGAPDLDDLATAGLLADLLLRRLPSAGASGATELALGLLRVGADPLAPLWHSSAGRHLRDLGLERDLGVAADLDRCDGVPVLGTPQPAHGGTLFPFRAAAGA